MTVREHGTFTFSTIKLKLTFSKISYCTFKTNSYLVFKGVIWLNRTLLCVFDLMQCVYAV